MSEHKRRMIAGEPYLADDLQLVAERLRCAELVDRLNATPLRDAGERQRVLRELLGAVGEDVTVMSPFRCDYGSLTEVGDRTFVNYNVVILDCAPVRIGNDVQIGPGVQLLTATHPLDPGERATRWESAQAITIGDGAWLGGGVIVGPGVSIGSGTVVGAGAVVVRDLPARVVAVGNPARVLRAL